MTIQLAGCILMKDGGILLLRRTKTGWYELPGGKLNAGESPLDAAVREVKEELIVDVEIGSEVGRTEFEHEGRKMSYIWFVAFIKDGQVPAIGEPEKFDRLEYVPLAELGKLPLSPNMFNLFEEIEAGRILLV